jgi:hypothetical protein
MSRTNPPKATRAFVASADAGLAAIPRPPVPKLELFPPRVTRIPRGPPRPKLDLSPKQKITRIPRGPPRPKLELFLDEAGERTLQSSEKLAGSPHGPSASPTPTPEAEVFRPIDKYTGNRKKARLDFRKDFGFCYDDKERVERELLKFLRSQPYQLPITPVLVAKITPVLTALTLRPGFDRSAHRPRRSYREERKLQSAIQYAWALTGRYLSDGIRRGEARTRAVGEAAAAYQVTESVLRSEMGLSKYSHLRPPEQPLPKRRRRRTSRRRRREARLGRKRPAR